MRRSIQPEEHPAVSYLGWGQRLETGSLILLQRLKIIHPQNLCSQVLKSTDPWDIPPYSPSCNQSLCQDICSLNAGCSFIVYRHDKYIPQCQTLVTLLITFYGLMFIFFNKNPSHCTNQLNLAIKEKWQRNVRGTFHC